MKPPPLIRLRCAAARSPFSKLPCLAVISLLLFLPVPAKAEILQFQFAGFVTGIESTLSSEFAVGETIVGSFAVDTTNLSPIPDIGDYPAFALSLVIGGDYPVSGQTGALKVLNDFGGSFDHFHASFDGPLTGAAFNGLTPYEFDLALSLPIAALSSEAIPLFLPLELLDGNLSSIDFGSADENTLDFKVTSLVAVPEPSLVALLGAGALFLTSRRRARAH
ncbi:MAG TPA: PEP-CTERM sorting domain-containing protein [Chthoniobacteraceae bacterium]|nr:PEP-CTERM sorting domain-containing protein [Chthoniobacteraceae bacterium]